MVDHEAIKEKVLEHSFRLDASERLSEQHNREIGTLRNATNQLRMDLNDSINSLRQELSRSVNKIILALVVIVFLGENAMPFLLKIVG